MYVPLNVNVFAAAFSGAMSAMSSPEKSAIVDPIPAHYEPFCLAAMAWAQAVDTAWGGVPVNQVNVNLLQAVSQNYHASHPIAPSLLALYSNPTNWIIAAEATVAIVQEGDINFANAGIIPPPFGGGGSSGILRVRGVSLVDFVDITAFVVADIGGSNDGITYQQGDLVLLFNQNYNGMAPANPEQNGPWVVGPVDGRGAAPLTRPAVWANGLTLQTGGIQIETGSEGLVYSNTTWYAMGAQDAGGQVATPTNTFLVGTDDPGVYPQHVGILTTFVAGVASMDLPVLGLNSSVSVALAANTGDAATVRFEVFLTPGNLDFSGNVEVDALTAASAVNTNEIGDVLIGLFNQGHMLATP